MPSGGGASAPSDEETMDVDARTTLAALAVAAEFAGTSGISDTPIIDSASEGIVQHHLEPVAEGNEVEPGHSRVTTPAYSAKRNRSAEEMQQEQETANMADSTAAELADSLVIRDRPEAMQQERLRVEDGHGTWH